MPTISNNEATEELQVQVPRQSSWHVPIGSYSGSIRSLKLVNRFADNAQFQLVRILFGLLVPGSNLDYLAKVDLKLDLNEGSDLWHLVCRLMGRKALQDCSEGTFDLQQLVGVCCDIEVDHVMSRAEDYEFPLVVVTNVQASGTLVRPVQGEEN